MSDTLSNLRASVNQLIDYIDEARADMKAKNEASNARFEFLMAELRSTGSGMKGLLEMVQKEAA